MSEQSPRFASALGNDRYRGTGGLSKNIRSLGFQPAFIDRETATVHLSRYPDGRLAPCHLPDSLPAELVVARNVRGHAMLAKASVVTGFVHGGYFYTRDEAAAMLVSAAEIDESPNAEAPLRRAA